MEIVRIFGRAFEELGITGDFTSLSYTEDFIESGNATLVLPMTSAAAALIIPDGYVETPAGVMYRVETVVRDSESGTVRADCTGLTALLRGTVIAEEYTVSGSVCGIMSRLVRDAVQNLPESLRLNIPDDGKTVTFSSGRSYLYDDLVSLCHLGGVGMKLEYDGESLVFSVLTGRDRREGTDDPVIMSDSLGTCEAGTLTLDLSSYKNVAVVTGTEREDGGRYTVTVRANEVELDGTFPDSAYFDRCGWVNFTAPVSGYMYEGEDGKKHLDEAAYTAAMRRSGAAYLGRMRPRAWLSVTADLDGTALLVGDTVRMYDEDSGISRDAVVRRIETVYDGNEKTVRGELCSVSDTDILTQN